MSAAAGPSTKPVTVVYCNVCSLPAEYCEFGSSISKCKTWLEEQDPQLFAKLYGEGKYYPPTFAWLKYEKPAAISILIAKPYCPFLTDAIKEKIGTLSLSAQEKLEAEADKAERKAEKKAETEKKKKAVSIHHPLRATLRMSDPHFHSHPYITGCQGHDQTRSPNKAKDLDVYS
jgi:hypothetical protein